MKLRIDTELDYSDGETIYHVEKKLVFLWVPILSTKNEYRAKALYEFLKEGEKPI